MVFFNCTYKLSFSDITVLHKKIGEFISTSRGCHARLSSPQRSTFSCATLLTLQFDAVQSVHVCAVLLVRSIWCGHCRCTAISLVSAVQCSAVLYCDSQVNPVLCPRGWAGQGCHVKKIKIKINNNRSPRHGLGNFVRILSHLKYRYMTKK